MSAARTQAPELEGYSLVQQLGSGGFSEVYLYQQTMPSRQVAVKVLHQGVSANTASAFTAEANVMAQLSTHPSIVTIFGADIARDGRPYLVMEYYSRPNLSVRSRQRPLPVADALDITIRIAGAVETAHRAGIIHRDIKPANILTSAYGKPGLTDFGISAAKSDLADREAGLSIPWCAPEVIEGRSNGTEVSDVYSLAATLYSLLAGRSPFEIPGQRNGQVDLLARITGGSPAPIDRSEVPVGLKRVIAIALDRDPANRPASAAEFARMLQEVEVQMRLAVTPFDVLAESSDQDLPVDDGDDGATRVRGATVVRPTAARSQTPASPGLIQAVPDRPAARTTVPEVPPNPVPGAPEIADTILRKPAQHDPESVEEAATPKGGSVGRWLALAGTAVVATAIIIVGVSGGGGAETPGSQPTLDQDAVVIRVPTPTGLTIARTSEATASATWSVAEPEEGDFYSWRRWDPAGVGARGSAEEPALLIEGLSPQDKPCLDVWLVRKNGKASEQPATACAEG